MAYLIKLENGVVTPTVEALLMEPFKSIWTRDKTKKKEIAHKDFGYIEYMTSMLSTNPFRGYSEEARHVVSLKELKLPPTWEPDILITQGMKKVVKFQTEASFSYTYYQSTKRAVEEVKRFFNTVDLTELKSNGTPLYKPKDITSTLDDTMKLLNNMDVLKKKVEEELFEEIKIRAGKKISIFADPASFND